MSDKIKIIQNKKCLKLICGAANENVNEIEKLVYIYSQAGFNMVDICAEGRVLKAAQNALKKADKENDVLICVSVGLQSDIHVSKAAINKQKCNLCQKCISICKRNAIFLEDNKIFVDEKKCIGCSKCTQVCEKNAIITENKYKPAHTMLLPLISEGIDCVEFHCSSEDKNMILDSFNKIKSIYKGNFSICMNHTKLPDKEIIDLINKMSCDNSFIIFQADGCPMNGGADDYGSTLQSVAFAQIIRNAKLPVYLILSGGTNSKTAKLAKECNVNIDGIALGSYARKIVNDLINKEDFWTNIQTQNEAIQRAKNLAESLLAYM